MIWILYLKNRREHGVQSNALESVCHIGCIKEIIGLISSKRHEQKYFYRMNNELID